MAILIISGLQPTPVDMACLSSLTMGERSGRESGRLNYYLFRSVDVLHRGPETKPNHIPPYVPTACRRVSSMSHSNR